MQIMALAGLKVVLQSCFRLSFGFLYGAFTMFRSGYCRFGSGLIDCLAVELEALLFLSKIGVVAVVFDTSYDVDWYSLSMRR